MSNKNYVPLNEFILLQRGFDLPQSDRISGDIPVVASTGVAGFHNEYKVDAPGVVIGRSGSIGGGQYIKEKFWPLNTTLWVKDFKGHDARYVYYLLKSIDFHRFNVGTGVPTLNRNHLSSVLVKNLGYINEKVIAKTLGDLDDKIHLNNQINQTLESIAQAIFKSWFIDFDPVRAKMAAKQKGKDPERAAMCAISGKSEVELQQMTEDDLAELRATASLFPDELVESELGGVPNGWEVGKLQEVIDLNPRRTLKKDSLAPYLDMKNVRTQGHLVDEVILRNMTSGTKFINGDTLLARITPCLENGKTAYVDFLLDNEVGWGSTEFIVLRPKEHLPTALGYFIARQENFRTLAIQSMTGTSGRQRANADTLANQSWLIYPADLMIVFDKYAGKYLTHIKNNGLQNGILKNIRDALLPKLLSGELDATLLKK